MWVKMFSKVYQGVTKEEIWRVWVDVNNWPKWDRELEYCKLDNAFTEGNQFTLKVRGGPKLKIYLSKVEANKTFTDQCKFFGASMYDIHELEETSAGVRITNTIKVTGILRFIWVRLVARNVANSVPSQTDALVNYARRNHD